MVRGILLISLTTLSSCYQPKDSLLLKDILSSMDHNFTSIVNEPTKHYLQVMYTQIDRDADQAPIFTTHAFNVNPKKYFYPASTVKLPAAVLSLDKLRRYESLGITKDTKLTIGSSQDWMSPVKGDSTHELGYATVAHYIKKIFVVSDNDAYNRLYEFLGQERFNQRMWDLGYLETRIRHRLSIRLSPDQNKYSNAFSFYSKGTKLLDQPMQYSSLDLDVNTKSNFIGKSYIVDGKKIESPMDFSSKNFFSIAEQHSFLQQVMFPDYVNTKQRLYLNASDYTFLYEWMSKLPKESMFPSYSDRDKYFDGYCKFFMFGDTNEKIPKNIRIYNKVGMAYGFLIDNAYIIDTDNNIEFFLTASVYSNNNETLNDDRYEYDEITLPFMAELGTQIYKYELSRKKTIAPDFSRFIQQ